MQVRKHILRKLGHPVTRPLRTMGYRDFTSNDDWKENLISFTSLVYHPQRKKIVCGMTAFNNDLMFEYDPSEESFTDLGFRREAEKFEIKIHRSLQLDSKGNVYGATACLHREDQRAEGRGGPCPVRALGPPGGTGFSRPVSILWGDAVPQHQHS